MLVLYLLLMAQIAKEEEKGVYLNFLNFLVNDSIFLLDESLNMILELKEIEAEMSNSAEWERRPGPEREERLRLFHSRENVSSETLCLKCINLLNLFAQMKIFCTWHGYS